jgi:hypothetical protein
MADRRQDAAQYLGLEPVPRRQAGSGEQRIEGVASAFKGREAQPDRGAEHHSVAHGVAGQATGEQPQHGELDALLDQPDTKVDRPELLTEKRRFQDRGPQHDR